MNSTTSVVELLQLNAALDEELLPCHSPASSCHFYQTLHELSAAGVPRPTAGAFQQRSILIL